MIDYKIGFNPVQGKESTILGLDYHEGWLYFATDTKKIYLDAHGEAKLPMGGNSGVFYGQMRMQETPDENQKEFSFEVYDLEVNNDTASITIPNVNDLILNIPDGCFYRVTDIEGTGDSAIINTLKLTIAGGGGGGSTGGGPASLAGITFNRITPQSITTLLDVPCPIQFTVTAKDSSGELTGPGTYRLLVNGVEKARGAVLNNNPEDPRDINEIDVSPYLGTGENTIKVFASMDTGGSSSTEASKTWKVNATSISIDWNPSFTEAYSTEEQYAIEWDLIGGAGIEKTTYILIDGYYELSKVTSGTGSQTLWIDPIELGLTHGVHKFEMHVEASVGISELATPAITKNIMFREPDNSNYIINHGYYGTGVTQYDTVKIPITIYGKDNAAGTATVHFKENGSDKGSKENFANGYVHEFAYTPVNHGPQVLSFQCGTSELTLLIEVEPLGIDINEVPNYAFKFKANEFADNGSIQKWEDKGVKVSFSERFDWVNGGLNTEEDENGNPRQYVCVKAGSTMTIDYNVFGIDARQKGKCVKIIFKATKCKDYDGQAVSCHDGSRGLVLNAQNAIFNSSDIALKVPYCEDSYIEFELDIASTEEKKYYIRPWIDGIPAGIKVYNPNSDDFYTDSSNKLVIGSEDCDVYIYLIKVYERHLKDDDHLNNFIADAPNAAEMVSRFRRNDILDETGEISPTKLAAANPDCRVHVYDISRMTMHKKDKVENCTYTQYHGGSNAVLNADGVTIKVQGTSSAAYGLAAFNLDSEFENGFTDADGNHFDEWAMNENSIPVNFFCTKVNVASAEQANNALNQEWYNRYQPYKTVVRGRNPKARDTMEFTPGVLFIKDSNKETNDKENGGKGDNVFKDTPGYLNKPYAKMYSVCNMGNSKDNVTVFHDVENPMECCVENGDNQLPGQWMTTPQGGYKVGDSFVAVDLMTIDEGTTTVCPDGLERSNRALWETGMDEIYGFRYPDGIDEVKKLDPQYAEAMITGWFRLVKWMAESNPSEKYAIIEFKDGYSAVTYASETDFNAEPLTKYIFNKETEEYEVATSYEDDSTVYYIVLTAEQQFNRYNKNLYTIDPSDENRIHNLVNKEEGFDSTKTYYYETAHIYGATNEKLPERKTYTGYKFRGYKAPGDLAKYQADYTPIVAGHTESAYAGNYDYDTTEYRMAKMLEECENYLCMDSVVFHYLFIERHSMVDNVAKNTFWSTEDGLVWNLTKDYDNDTSDGNNNQGALELTYGLEPGDVDAGGTSIFNAGNSVWLRFIRGLYSTCQRVYQALDTSQGDMPSAWSAEAYLDAFNKWQSVIPERCWIEDYYRKYIRPYEVYNDDMFLDMHEGGKKTYQRKQYETYQNYYISSKYFGSSCKTNYFTMRPNGQDLSSFKIPITLYADCYIHGAFGSGTENPNFSQRCKRNTLVEMISPIDNATDATTYIFPANLYQSLGNKDTGLNSLKLEQFTVTSAKKLRTLALGTYTSDTVNTALNTIGIGSCENLEELHVAKMRGEGLAALDLTQAPGIKKVDARDSGFTSVLIASGAPLKSLEMNKPNSIVLSDLTELQTLNFQDPTALTKVDIDNIDTSYINSKEHILDLVDSSKFANARLLNVKWVLQNEDADEINTSNNTIRTLEMLKNTKFVTNNGQTIPQTATLSGELRIPESVYNGSNSVGIYNTYAKDTVYPNLDIIFEGSNAKMPKVSIYNGNNEVCWSKRIQNGGGVSELTLRTGPNGKFDMSMISKQSSMSADFTFEKQWEIYDKDNNLITTINSELPIYSESIEDDISLKPVFTSKTRQYTLQFYTYNPETKKVDKPMGAEIVVDYGTPLADVLPKEIPWKPEESNYGLKEANNFVGYGLTQKTTTPVKNDYTVSNNQEFYAIFERLSDISAVVHPEWFDYIPYTYIRDNEYSSYSDIIPSPKIHNVEGYAVVPKAGLILQGKITIPAMHDNKPVIAIGNNFATESKQQITHIFCEKGSSLYEILGNAFYKNSILKYFDFSQNTVRFIDQEAFFSCGALSADDMVLSKNLFFVGSNAFNGAFTSETSIAFKIPGNIGLVGSGGFNNLMLPDRSSVEIGSAEDYSKLFLETPNYTTNFTQNSNIRAFRFWSKRYDSYENTIPNAGGAMTQVQVLSAFVRNMQDIDQYNLEINHEGV